MSSLGGVWGQVRKMAGESGMPDRPRAVLREYLQVKFLDYLYQEKLADKLAFVGGTSLRILRGLPRFSEDLDFDNLGVSVKEMVLLVEKVAGKLRAENIQVELKKNEKKEKTYFELRFPDLLKELKISTNPREKLMIKLDYSSEWRGQAKEVILVNRLGIVQGVVTNSLDQILVQKLAAYGSRKRVQPRDMYDVVWLWGQGARLDEEFAQQNQREHLLETAANRCAGGAVTAEMVRKLKPFMFVPGEERKLELFGQVVENLRG